MTITPAGRESPDVEMELDRPVALHALTFLDEGDDVTVGRPDVDSYCVLPADGALLLRALADGASPRAAADTYLRRYGEPVDLPEFLAALDELGFIARPGEVPAAVTAVRWQRVGRALFSPVAWAAYAVLLVAAVVAMGRHPDLVPQYRNLFFTDYITAVVLLLFVGQVPFLLLHESFHMLAGRRLGLRSRLGVGRRLYFVVFETSLDGLVSVPRRKRYLPILAGMLADLLVVAALTLVAATLRRADGSQPLVGGVCLALAFATVLRFVWQFYFYLQTDVYHVVVTVFGCIDLQNTARLLLADRLRRLLGRDSRVDPRELHPTDRAVARWYSWLLLVGYALSLATLVLAGIPATVHIFRVVLGRFGSGDATVPDVTDSVVFLLVNVVQFAALGAVMARDRRRRRLGATAHVTNLEAR